MSERRAPAGLDRAGRALWRRVVADYELDVGELVVLAEAARCADELARLTAALADAELLTTGSAGQPRPSPLLAEVRAHRAALSQLVGALRLPAEDEDAGRSPRSRQAARAARSRWDRRATGGGRGATA